MEWDPRLRRYSGSAELRPGHVIRINIERPDDPGHQSSWPRRARAMFDGVALKEGDLRLQIAARLLKLHNTTWRGEEEPEIDEAQFAARIRLDAATLQSDGRGQLFYGDGDLFWGHALVASLDGNFAVERVELFG